MTWALYCLLAPLPVACSYIEWKRVPWQQARSQRLTALGARAMIWVLVFGFDALTIWNGLGVTTVSTPLIMQQVAATTTLRGIFTAVLTILPEWFMREAVGMIRRAVGWTRTD
ncbi:MAG: hypothetical protein HC828_08500 [Blastochloris sp.]|nr:hypothetical protein [Blastochloris sp.]